MAIAPKDEFGTAVSKKTSVPPKKTAAPKPTVAPKPAVPSSNFTYYNPLSGSTTPPSPTINGQAVLSKLTGGQTLTDAEKRYLNLPVTPATTSTSTTSNTTPAGGGNNTPDKPVWKKAGTVMTLQGPVDVDANGIAENGSVPVASNDDSSIDKTTNELSASDKDAYALLKEVFINYGLEELVPAITKLMSNNVGPNQASLMLKTNPEYNAAYIKRFAGNEARRKAGLNVLSEAEYLDLENSYSQTLNAYGVKNYFGTTTEAKRNAMANIIGNDISATEFKDRVETVVTRVNNADPKIKETLKNFYDIKDDDLTSYFLNPKDNLPKLQEKVTAAEIGAAAANQKLAYSKATAEDLARFGITKEQAQEGYSTIGEIMPTATKLGEIYGDQYTQATAEQEVFKGTASAKRKRQQLAEREAASFSGSSGRLRTGKAKGNEGSF
jgi:hypothetical protein